MLFRAATNHQSLPPWFTAKVVVERMVTAVIPAPVTRKKRSRLETQSKTSPSNGWNIEQSNLSGQICILNKLYTEESRCPDNEIPTKLDVIIKNLSELTLILCG